MCCPGEVPCLLSCVLQLVSGRASSRIPVAPGLALSPAAGGKGEKKENVFFLTHATARQTRRGGVSPPALYQLPTPLCPCQQLYSAAQVMCPTLPSAVASEGQDQLTPTQVAPQTMLRDIRSL